MKKYITLILIVFTFINCTPRQELRVMAWNVWHGHHSKLYPDVACKNTIDIIRESEADVVMMIETYGAAPDVAKALDMNYELLSSNLSIYSRYPIIKKLTFDSINTFNFAGVILDVNGQEVIVFNTWLHYLPDCSEIPTGLTPDEVIEWEESGSRDDEIKTILSIIESYIDSSDIRPIIVGGDFNSHSHLDWVEETKDINNHQKRVVQWPVSKLMEDSGFADSYREANEDVVNDYGVTWLYGNDYGRIDYIFYQGENIEIKKSYTDNAEHGKMFIFNDKEFFYPSDHGFVLSTFLLGE